MCETRIPGGAAGEMPRRSPRQAWMAVLARARRDELEAALERAGGQPPHVVLKPAETGTAMIEARAGGTGRRFNLGEATLTRCVVRLEDGTMGFAYALGSDRRKALVCALLDAMLQHPARGPRLQGDVIVPLAARQRAAAELASRKAAATKVDFFTLVRGHD